MTKEPKFCKDCRFAVSDESSPRTTLRCGNSKVNSKDGSALASPASRRGTDCTTERGKRGWFAVCGMKGKQWELKRREL